jgi:hypothetical protein
LVLSDFNFLGKGGYCGPFKRITDDTIRYNQTDFWFFEQHNKIDDTKETSNFKMIQQKVDHFDVTDNRTFLMRYYENREFLKPGGPIFIFVMQKLEGHLESYTYDMMKNLSGILFHTEHRYYGKSLPTEEFIVDGKIYLSVDQTLADLKHFIDHIKATIPEIKNSSVILVGGSVGGNLVTWFMQKYPGVAVGAWASSSLTEPNISYSLFIEEIGKTMSQLN